VKRLDKIFRMLGKPARGKPCEAINGITDEGAEIIRDFRGMPALDAGLLSAAQAVEHYEISPLRNAANLGQKTRHGGFGGAAPGDARRRRGD
jgi:ferritin-like metal-binding protein YciE